MQTTVNNCIHSKIVNTKLLQSLAPNPFLEGLGKAPTII